MIVNRRYLSTTDKIIANCVFDFKYRIYCQYKFSWIYMNTTSIDVYDINGNLI